MTYRHKITGFILDVPDGTVFTSKAYEAVNAPKAETPKVEKKPAPKKTAKKK